MATSSTDVASYGDLYQWGRAADGHQLRTSATITTLATSSTPGHGDFFIGPTSPYNWLATPNDNLWQVASGVNNPCPYGYRIPTRTELDSERALFSSQDAAGAFASPLKLPVAGFRTGSTGTLSGVGSSGYYWSSTVSGSGAGDLSFSSSNATMSTSTRANGLSVRCVKD